MDEDSGFHIVLQMFFGPSEERGLDAERLLIICIFIGLSLNLMPSSLAALRKAHFQCSAELG